MTNLNDTLPAMMHRATEHLEPVSTDLLERSVRQGVRLRRRRTTLLTAGGAGAVLATAGLIAGGTQLLGRPSEATVAGPPLPSVTPSAQVSTPATPQDTLATLKSLIQGPGITLSKPEARGGGTTGFNSAAYVADDGKGASRVEVMVETSAQGPDCKPPGSGCKVRADGSILTTRTNTPEYPAGRNTDGVVSTAANLYFPDGRHVGLTSYNASIEKGQPSTRTASLFTAAQLTAMVESKAWTFPAPGVQKPFKSPGKSK